MEKNFIDTVTVNKSPIAYVRYEKPMEGLSKITIGFITGKELTVCANTESGHDILYRIHRNMLDWMDKGSEGCFSFEILHGMYKSYWPGKESSVT